jgi:hypothetical protein
MFVVNGQLDPPSAMAKQALQRVVASSLRLRSVPSLACRRGQHTMSTPPFFCRQCTIEVTKFSIIGPLFATTRLQCPLCHERVEGLVGVSGWVGVSLASSPSLTSTHRCHSSLQLTHHLFDLAHGALRTPSTHSHTPTHTNTSANPFFLCHPHSHSHNGGVCPFSCRDASSSTFLQDEALPDLHRSPDGGHRVHQHHRHEDG